jgi:hypothetical protein
MERISRSRVSLNMNGSSAGALTAAIILVSLLGCRPPAEAATGTLRGEVVAGPVCPVVTDPPDAACEDRPVPGAELVLELAEGDGGQVRVLADDDGLFELQLAPGRYTLTPQPMEGLLGTAAPITLEIAAGMTTQLSVVYDTGIR